MLSVPEVTSTARRTGRAELDEHVQGVESAEIDVRLEMKDRPREAVLEEIATEGVAAPGHERHDRPADLAPHRPHAVGHAREHRRQDLRRRSSDAARSWRARCKAQMAQVPGVVDLSTEPQTDIPTLQGARRSGSGRASRARSRATVAEALQTARVGPCRGPDAGGADRFSAGRPLRARRRRRSSTRSATTQIQTPDRRQIPLSAVATIQARPRPELRHARERPAPDRRAEQRRRARPAQRGERHSGARRARTSRCRRATTSSTAGSSRARPQASQSAALARRWA